MGISDQHWSEALLRGVVAVIAILAAFSAVPAHAGEIDQAAKDYLEGIWLVGTKPDKGPCIANSYNGETQWEFEFRKSGGRVITFEPPDLLTPIAIQRIGQDGEHLSVWVMTRDGQTVLLIRLRLLPPDRLEILPRDGDGTHPPQITSAYRCGDPDPSVNQSVSAADLASLTPNSNKFRAFIKTDHDLSDDEVCRGVTSNPKSFRQSYLQFELFGPVHYWVFGIGDIPRRPGRLALDMIRKVERVNEQILKLFAQEHSRGNGWDPPGGTGKTYELTILDKGARIEIPELSATFIRCMTDGPAAAD